MRNFQQLMENRQLLSIERRKLDANPLRGVILGHSAKLLILQQVYDFHLEGLVVLRKKDISNVSQSATDDFQKQMLVDEGLFAQIDFDTRFELSDWKSIIEQLGNLHGLLIIENEDPADPQFLIGQVSKCSKSGVAMRFFDGCGIWDDEPVKLPYREITLCTANSNYVNKYRNYFSRKTAAQQ